MAVVGRQTRGVAQQWDIVDDASARARRHLESVRAGPVVPPTAAIHALAELPTELPADPVDPEAVLDLLDRFGSPAAVRQSGGRYFGFVNGGIEPAGLGAAMLALAWDQNAALPVMSPIGAHLDEIAARWVVDLLGLPESATATFCAGATVANLTSVVTARDTLLRREGWDAAERGFNGAPPISVIASAEIHTSVLKALRLAGLGTGSVLSIPTDSHGRAIAGELPATDGPTLVLLQAGNVNTGHSDPFREIVERLGGDRDRSWVHVDGAFGLWANASADRRQLLDGVELADSWATDGHKWLNTPYDCGVAIVARGDELVESMRMDAAYARADGGRSPMNMGIQMSQAARAIPVWAVLASLGRDGVAAMVERCCRHAERFAELLDAGGAEVLAPPVLNQVLVAFGDDDTTDAVIDRVQRDGVCWMGGTTWHGRRAMRISVSDTSTTADDVQASVASVLAALNG